MSTRKGTRMHKKALMGRPRPVEPPTRLVIYLPEALNQKIREAAAEGRRSVSAQACMYFEECLDKAE